MIFFFIQNLFMHNFFCSLNEKKISLLGISNFLRLFLGFRERKGRLKIKKNLDDEKNI